MSSLTIYDVAVVTVDDSNAVIDRGWVHVEGERIVEIARGDVPRERRLADTAIDGSGMALIPGLVNGHTHLFQTMFRGLGDDKSLLEWLRDYIWPAAGHMTNADLAAATAVGIAENFLSGATSIIDHQYVHPVDGMDEAALQIAEQMGARYTLASGWADRNYHPPLMETLDAIVARAEKTAAQWHGRSGRLAMGLAPLIPWGCSDDAMRATVNANRRWGGGTHTHCSETAVEIQISLDERGLRHVPWLASLGALGSDVQLAHSVWVDENDLDLIAASGSVVVHCPVSNMYLAAGVAPVPEMRRRGIPVALASDGPGSNNRQDMFEVLKASVLLQKVHHLDPVIMQPEDALNMACRGGAAAMQMSDDLGAIEVGRLADLVLIDLRSPFIAPVHRVVSALVFNATPRDVKATIVAGQVVAREGELLTGDIGSIMAEAETRCRALFERSGLRRR